ncbi:MAG: pilus assembly protein, partial [Pseudomonadota bacterium]|nr:pilus assembly protein [Pseudomonadota bacterium]
PGPRAATARQFLNERKAMAAVEFAMIGAPLLLTIVAIFQSALFVYNSSRLDAATRAAARQIVTGAVQAGGMTAAQFRTNLLCPQLPATIPCSSVIVNLQTFSEASFPGGFYSFVNGTQTAIIVPPLDNTQTSFCPGGSGEYVYLQVFYAMPLLGMVWLPAVTTTFQGQTVALVSAAAAFKNEPYIASYTPPAGC